MIVKFFRTVAHYSNACMYPGVTIQSQQWPYVFYLNIIDMRATSFDLCILYSILFHFIHFRYFKNECFQDLNIISVHISENIEVTVEFLTEIDKLVQLIESPIFTCK